MRQIMHYDAEFRREEGASRLSREALTFRSGARDQFDPPSMLDRPGGDGWRDGVEIGPYCVVGPHVELKDGVRLIGQVNITGATTVGEGTVVYPFASLGTSPQSVH